ncbi:Vacuolar protein sorting-associated protein 21 [Tritrichomonas foetus]|uniref:Vacuolar protein sorting-associated protein 21 n=1 Tax=Tritrichomonas foetus TaxID=1144522 RepID=A0A1J4KG39_9EUKA|nr:Vacuolar protein sorting-associated protein 21 [Tritrichomonas foetus]|eukprot:OHT08317.1 Vacuolar protein sorting-associated protein 21 [Tritrichomonas foetus]
MSVGSSIKIVLLGSAEVGKTSISTRYAMGSFDSSPQATIGVAFLTRSIKIGEEEVQLEIWDTAGQEKFKSVTLSYLRQARAVLCIYDLSKPETVRSAFDYAIDAKEKIDQNAIIAIIGNKSDICEDMPDEVIPKAEEHDFLYFTCSAKTGENIENVFSSVAKETLRNRHEETSETKVYLTGPNVPSQKKPCC